MGQSQGTLIENGSQQETLKFTHSSAAGTSRMRISTQNCLRDNAAIELSRRWRIPQNPRQQGSPCDRTIASIFGGDDAIAAASGFEPTGFPDSDAWGNGQGPIYAQACLDFSDRWRLRSCQKPFALCQVVCWCFVWRSTSHR